MTFLGFDWQKFAVALIVLAAAAYFARRALARLRSFGASGQTGAPACGNCEQNDKPRAQTPAAKVLVQIAPLKSATRKR